MLIIGMCGKMCAGKDTLADQLIYKNIVDMKFSFADPLKEFADAIFGTNRYIKDRSTRAVYQKFGKACVQISQEVFGHTQCWTKLLVQRIKEYHGKGVVISDVRFPYEVKSIKNLGGIIVFLSPDDDIRRERIKNVYHYSDEEIDQFAHHVSETAVDECFHMMAENGFSFYNFANNTPGGLELIVKVLERSFRNAE